MAAAPRRRVSRRALPSGLGQLTLFDRFAAAPGFELGPRRLEPPPELAARLDPLLGGRLRALVLTDNRSRILSSRSTADGGLEVRLHRCFAAAPAEVVARVADFLVGRGRHRREALAVIRSHFDRHGPRLEASTRRHVALRARGEFHDLAAIRDELAGRCFEVAPQVAVTWGRAPVQRRRGRRATILLGSYDAAANLIRIHPRLDRTDVPRFVVAAVVYHEMLHAAMPAQVRGGRRVLHPPELRRRERELAEHSAAEAWLAAHLPRLLRC